MNRPPQDPRKETKKSIVKNVGIAVVLFLALITGASSININQTAPIENFVTSSNTVNVNYSFSMLNSEPPTQIKYTFNTASFDYLKNLLVFLNFDNRSTLLENDSLSIDLSGNNHNATCSGFVCPVTTTIGKYGGSRYWNGTQGQEMKVSYDASKPYFTRYSNWTVTLWYNQSSGSRRLFSFGNSSSLGRFYVVADNTSNSILTYSSSSSFRQSVLNVVTWNSWQHLAISYDGINNMTRIYLNGVDVTNYTYETGLYWPNMSCHVCDFYVGYRWATYPLGQIDEVMLFNESLNATQIYTIYNSQLTKLDAQNWTLSVTNNDIGTTQLNQTNLSAIYFFSLNISNSSSSVLSNGSVTQYLPVTYAAITMSNSATKTINPYFYGTNTHGVWGSEFSWIDTDGDGTNDEPSNYTWHRNAMQASNLTILRVDSNLEYLANANRTFKNVTYNNVANINTTRNTIAWAKANNMRVIVTMAYMPDWLRNVTSDCTAADCPANNNTRWGQLVTDYLTEVSCDPDTCIVEVWNEIDVSSTFMSGATNAVRSLAYNALYNATYIAVKALNSSYQVGGPATSSTQQPWTTPLLLPWMGNFSQQIDFVSYHNYRKNDSDYDSIVSSDLDYLYAKFSLYNFTARIYFNEWNEWNFTRRQDPVISAQQLSLAYITVLNYNPANISMLLYQWSNYRNSSSTDYQNMVSEPQLANTYYNSYNVTRIFANHLGAGATILSSSANESNISVVAGNYGDRRTIIVVNKGSSFYNLTLNLEPGRSSTNIYDILTGTNYTGNGTSFGSIFLPARGTLYLQTEIDIVPPSINLSTPANLSTDTDGTLNFTFTPSDEYGLVTCSLYGNGALYTSIVPTNGTANSIVVSGVRYGHPLAGYPTSWYVSCTDNAGNTNVSDTWYVYTDVTTQNGLTGVERSLITLAFLCGLLFFSYTVFTGKLDVGTIIILAVAAVLVAVVIGLL